MVYKNRKEIYHVTMFESCVSALHSSKSSNLNVACIFRQTL